MIKPIGSRVLIFPDTAEKQTASGIVLPDSKRDKPSMTGEVIEVGPDVVSVQKGDKVIFNEGYFETYKEKVVLSSGNSYDEIKYQIGKEEDILAIIVHDPGTVGQLIAEK